LDIFFFETTKRNKKMDIVLKAVARAFLYLSLAANCSLYGDFYTRKTCFLWGEGGRVGGRGEGGGVGGGRGRGGKVTITTIRLSRG
jgi:hypothetical protein